MPVPYVSVDAPRILVRRARGADSAAIFTGVKRRLSSFAAPNRLVYGPSPKAMRSLSMNAATSGIGWPAFRTRASMASLRLKVSVHRREIACGILYKYTGFGFSMSTAAVLAEDALSLPRGHIPLRTLDPPYRSHLSVYLQSEPPGVRADLM